MVPTMFFKPGVLFLSAWFEGEVEILSTDKDKNILMVRIHQNGESRDEEWNYEQTVIGFSHGDYKLKEYEGDID